MNYPHLFRGVTYLKAHRFKGYETDDFGIVTIAYRSCPVIYKNTLGNYI